MAKSGDVCQKCKSGRMKVYRSVASGAYQFRYLKCSKCGANDTQHLSEQYVYRRK